MSSRTGDNTFVSFLWQRAFDTFLARGASREEAAEGAQALVERWTRRREEPAVEAPSEDTAEERA